MNFGGYEHSDYSTLASADPHQQSSANPYPPAHHTHRSTYTKGVKDRTPIVKNQVRLPTNNRVHPRLAYKNISLDFFSVALCPQVKGIRDKNKSRLNSHPLNQENRIFFVWKALTAKMEGKKLVLRQTIYSKFCICFHKYFCFTRNHQQMTWRRVWVQ